MSEGAMQGNSVIIPAELNNMPGMISQVNSARLARLSRALVLSR